MTPQLTTCLWFDGKGRQAATFYASIFPNSTINGVGYFEESNATLAQTKAGEEMTIHFTLNGNPFMALNGGPKFSFTEATSFMIHCDTQEEVDHYWNKLSEGGEPSMCGWLKDQFGVSWQVIPKALMHLISTGNGDQRNRVIAAMLQMRKLDIATLQAAFEG